MVTLEHRDADRVQGCLGDRKDTPTERSAARIEFSRTEVPA